jgi:hypothetical protein
MNVRALLRPVRRLWPQKVRTRLTLIYAALFFATGAALLTHPYLRASREQPPYGALPRGREGQQSRAERPEPRLLPAGGPAKGDKEQADKC